MALVVEDGTGLANAESYVSVAEADTHLANRGFQLWATMSTTEKEWAIRRAMDYIEQVFRDRWAGARTTTAQALSWPRQWVPIPDLNVIGWGLQYVASNIVPAEVKRGTADLAYKAAHGELEPDQTRATIREKVDVIEVEYSPYSPQSPLYKSVENTLKVYFDGLSSELSRKVVRV